MSIDPAALEDLTDIFRVLGDPTRLRILDALSRGDLCVGDLARRLRVTESAVSHQLRLLRSARLVRARRAGRMIFYSLHDRHVLTLFDQAMRHVEEAGHGHARPHTDAGFDAPPVLVDGGVVPPKPQGGGAR